MFNVVGLPGPASEPHVEVALPGGLHMTWDTVATIGSLDLDWTPPQSSPGSASHSRDRVAQFVRGIPQHGRSEPDANRNPV